MYKYDVGHANISNITKNTVLNREITQLSKKGLRQMESTLSVAKEYDNALKYAERYTIAWYAMVGAFAACTGLAPIALLVGNKIAASKLTKLSAPVENVVSPINIKQAQAELKNTFVCASDAIKSSLGKNLKIIR